MINKIISWILSPWKGVNWNKIAKRWLWIGLFIGILILIGWLI